MSYSLLLLSYFQGNIQYQKFVSLLKGIHFQRKVFSPKFFSSKVGPFSEGDWCAGKPKDIKVFSLSKSCRKYQMYTIPLTLSSLQINTDSFANSADPDETCNKPSHPDPHCLPFCYWFLTETPICNNGCVQIQRWKGPFKKKGIKGLTLESPFQKLRGWSVNSVLTINTLYFVIYRTWSGHMPFMDSYQFLFSWHIWFTYCWVIRQSTGAGLALRSVKLRNK